MNCAEYQDMHNVSELQQPEQGSMALSGKRARAFRSLTAGEPWFTAHPGTVDLHVVGSEAIGPNARHCPSLAFQGGTVCPGEHNAPS
jgi:hypothetical protein